MRHDGLLHTWWLCAARPPRSGAHLPAVRRWARLFRGGGRGDAYARLSVETSPAGGTARTLAPYHGLIKKRNDLPSQIAKKMKILSLSRYDRLGSTSRVRAYQYLPYLRSEGIEITEAPLFEGEYLRRLYAGERIGYGYICFAYLSRLISLLRGFRFDLLWIEKELLPFLPPWCEIFLSACGIPYIVDYDDATFHQYDLHPNKLVRHVLGQKIDTVMRRAALVMVGNEYLAARARQAGARRVACLPTVVDLERYEIAIKPREGTRSFQIGWIGSPVTAHYLELVAEALRQISQESNTRLIVVGAERVRLDGVPLELRAWTEEAEVCDIQSFDVGIMPLADGPWEQGKCGYKIVQYMACGKPAVASPVGINKQIIEDGMNGFLATTTSQWVCALRALRDHEHLRERLGRRARMTVEKEYSLQVTAPRLVSLLRSVMIDRH
jgi:glycosyltransferase involved in cell wall biosynthesis